MARFYAEIFRKNKKAVLAGGDSEGVRAHVRGWDIGVEVSVFKNEAGEDEIVVSMTNGSNNPIPKETVYTLTGSDGQENQVVSPFTEIRITLPKPMIVNLKQDR